jgi:hypothetical protein
MDSRCGRRPAVAPRDEERDDPPAQATDSGGLKSERLTATFKIIR